MKLTLLSTSLREAMGKLDGLKSVAHLNKGFGNALVECSGGDVFIAGVDLERCVKVKIAGEFDEEFSCLLPRREVSTFMSFRRRPASSAAVTVTEKSKAGYEVSLSRGELGSLALRVPPVREFPSVPSFSENLNWHSVDAQWLCGVLPLVSFAACAIDVGHPVLGGVVFKDGVLAAADGFRLAVLQDKRLAFNLKEKQAIIPKTSVDFVSHLLSSEKNAYVAFEVESGRVYFKTKDIAFASVLIEGVYPSWEKLMPRSYVCKVVISTHDMKTRLGAIDDEVIQGAIRFKFEEAKCLIGAKGDNLGYALECPAELLSKEGGRIAFNKKYFLDSIAPFGECILEITNSSMPGKFTGDVAGLTIVTMPMYVAGWD